MTDFILFLRAYRRTRQFGFPLLWSIKAAWRGRKPTPELVKMFNTKVVLKMPTEKSDVELITKLAKNAGEAWNRVDELKADNAQLREALAFYADLSRDGPWHLPTEDYGKIARSALTGKEPSHE